MYRAIEIEREFRDKLVLNAKFFLMDIINKRIALGWEEPSEDGSYTIGPNDFKDTFRIMVNVYTTYDDDAYLEPRIVSEIHLDTDIWLTVKADYEVSDDDELEEEIYLRSLPLDQLVNAVCTLEDYADETPDAE